MIYVVRTEVYPDPNIVDWDFFTMENVVSENKLSYDEVVRIALENTLKDVEEIYKLNENLVKYTKATIVNVVEDDCFESEQ